QRHGARPRAGPARRLECRNAALRPLEPAVDSDFSARAVHDELAAFAYRRGRGDPGGPAVARPHLPRHALSRLACGPARSGGGSQPVTAPVQQPTGDPGPFSRFEFTVAWRYLRARRRDRFVSVIAGLTLTGIALGVAALIV